MKKSISEINIPSTTDYRNNGEPQQKNRIESMINNHQSRDMSTSSRPTIVLLVGKINPKNVRLVCAAAIRFFQIMSDY